MLTRMITIAAFIALGYFAFLNKDRLLVSTPSTQSTAQALDAATTSDVEREGMRIAREAALKESLASISAKKVEPGIKTEVKTEVKKPAKLEKKKIAAKSSKKQISKKKFSKAKPAKTKSQKKSKPVMQEDESGNEDLSPVIDTGDDFGSLEKKQNDDRVLKEKQAVQSKRWVAELSGNRANLAMVKDSNAKNCRDGGTAYCNDRRNPDSVNLVGVVVDPDKVSNRRHQGALIDGDIAQGHFSENKPAVYVK